MNSVFSAIQKHNMALTGKNVMVCVSGGADSMALLHFMVRNRQELGVGKVYACHFHHGLRIESDREQAMVERYCRENEVELIVAKGEMRNRKKPKGEGIESWARTLRHEFFRASLKNEDDLIAVAHNQNDRVETLLFHLMRGSGLRGARGIAPVNGSIVRPLIDTPRGEIEKYCAENEIPFTTDASNADNAFSRNKIRNQILPLMRGINENAVGNLADFCDVMQESFAYIELHADALLRDSLLNKSYSREKFLAAPKTICKAALLQLLYKSSQNVSSVLLEEALRCLKAGSGAVQLDSQTCLKVGNDAFSIVYNRQHPVRDYDIPFAQGTITLNNRYTVVVSKLVKWDFSRDEKNSKSVYINCLDYDKIEKNLHFRTRRAHDNFRSLARRNTKSLKKILNEMKIEPEQRDSYPVLADEKGVVWILGQGVCERVAVDDKSNNVFYLKGA